MTKRRFFLLALLAALLAVAVAGCGGDDDDEGGEAGGDTAAATTEEEGGVNEDVSGNISIEGSSTVQPITQAAAELFREANPDARISVGGSGTSDGFEAFCQGDTQISDASRPIDVAEEVPVCEENGVEFIEIPVAFDGISVVVNKQNDFATDVTSEELKTLWEPAAEDEVTTWDQVNPDFPAEPIELFGPGTDSGTFDFFTDVINGEEGASREDYEASEDDNQLVTGVAGTAGGLGYFGYSYFEANQDKLNLVQVDGGSGCVAPSAESIQDGSYKPLGRPIFMYPSKQAMAKPEVKAFMDFILANQQAIAEAAQIVPMTEEQATEATSALSELEGGA